METLLAALKRFLLNYILLELNYAAQYDLLLNVLRFFDLFVQELFLFESIRCLSAAFMRLTTVVYRSV